MIKWFLKLKKNNQLTEICDNLNSKYRLKLQLSDIFFALLLTKSDFWILTLVFSLLSIKTRLVMSILQGKGFIIA